MKQSIRAGNIGILLYSTFTVTILMCHIYVPDLNRGHNEELWHDGTARNLVLHLMHDYCSAT